ncbi:LIM/homeobox protein Awh-like [Oscarella lobularis]|uniref:LIM/homeobox protein Awh-like n=1 Tax=Oscarella lobularis TaxID=121494 RepID=UPI0033138AF9
MNMSMSQPKQNLFPPPPPSLKNELTPSPETTKETPATMLCRGCGEPIYDRFLLRVGTDSTWHEKCLACSACRAPLGLHRTCYARNDEIYCKLDYARLFGTKCAACRGTISPDDWIRRAKANAYHLACFACFYCKRQLSTGEEFVLHDDQIMCLLHCDYADETNGDGSGGGDNSRSSSQTGDGRPSRRSRHCRPKRARTTFSDHQIRILQANFTLESNPDTHELERISQITGLSKRVTQVWFQNARARQKRALMKKSQLDISDPSSSSSATGTTPAYGSPLRFNGNSVGGIRRCCLLCGQSYCLCGLGQ